MIGPVAGGRGAAVVLLVGLLLAGCSGTPAAGTAAPTAPAAPTVEPGSVPLPWPVAGAADAAALQAAVDAGAQPWLLEPTGVALAYAAAAHGWADAQANPGPDGTGVDVRNGQGERLTLSLAQPGRAGADGIWVVIAETPS